MTLLRYIILALLALGAQAKLTVITTTTNLADLVSYIGGEAVKVESLCKGTQDPHYLEAKPSYTFKLSRADLLVSIGAGLEDGWLPLVVRGSRNPRLRVGNDGRFVASDLIAMLEKDENNTSRSKGDVHPEGNPHFMLGPSMAIRLGFAIRDKLTKLDSSNKALFNKNALSFEKKVRSILERGRKVLGNDLKVVSYHKTLTYFYHEFKISNVDVLEPKPGVPPTASHIISLIKKIKNLGVKKIIVENYFDDAVALRVKRSVSGLGVYRVPVAVNGKEGINSLFDLYNHLISVMEMK